MSAKSIILKIVLGLLAVAVLAGGIYFMLKPQEAEKVENKVVFSADSAGVEKVEITGERNYSLVKTGDGWVMENLESIKVDKTFADTLVKSLCNIKSPMQANSAEATLSDFGLDKPAIEAKIVFAANEESLLVGNASGEYYYVKLARDEDVYLVSAADLYMLFLEEIKYLDDTVLQMYVDDVVMIAYSDVSLLKEEGGWIQKTPYNHLADEGEVKAEILEKISDISAIEIVPKEDVDFSRAVKVLITLADGTMLDFDVCGNYISYKNTNHAYKVSDDEVSFINVSAFDLINKYVAPIAITDVSGIKFASPEGEVNLTIEAPASEAPVFYKDGIEAIDASFRNFYQALMSLVVTKEGKASGEAEYEIVFTKTDGATHAIKFIGATESEFAVDINGEQNFLINKKSVTDVFENLKNIEIIY